MLFAWNDSKTWLPLISEVRGKRVRHRALEKILRSVYEGVVVFHGCRPVNIEIYRQRGLLRSNTPAIDASAREIFLSGEFPELTSASVEQAISKLGIRDHGRIFASLDRDNLLQYCGHYLIYGSERLCSIAADLNGNRWRDYQQELKRFGKPTLLHVALPWEYVTDSDRDQLARKVSSRMAKIRRQRTLPDDSFTFEFFDPLPGSAILHVEHPETIRDPLHNETPYTFRKVLA